MKNSMKKTLYRLLATTLLVTGWHLPALAQEDVEGIWEGKLEVAPDTIITVQFTLSRGADGSYSAVLNSPDNGAIKNMPASSASFDGEKLVVAVQPLSGSYSGTLNDGVFEGEWTQPGSSIAMNLSPYVKPALSAEAIALLQGEWTGKLEIPGGSLTLVANFEQNDEGELTGYVRSPDQGGGQQEMGSITFENNELFFRVPAAQAEYTGQMSGESIAGTFKQGAQSLPLSFEKGEYKAVLPTLSLTDADFEKLQGTWNGKLGALALVFHFEKNDEGIIFATIDSPDQGRTGLQVASAQVTDNRLHMSVAGINAQFRGELQGDSIPGEWTQGGMTNPLVMAKGEYVPTTPELALTDADMEILEGSWSGPMGPLTIIFNFGRDDAGKITATFDVPAQGVDGLAMTAAELTENKIHLEYTALGVVYEGEIDGITITGTWTQGSRPNALAVTKVE